jgi:cytochrome b subunit of formate dehydrogenase
MDNKEALEIYKEAQKAGIYMASIMFLALLVVSGLFMFYIYQSYKPMPVTSTITQTQDGENNHRELTNGEAKSNN